MTLLVPQNPVERIAADKPPEVNLSREALDRLAHLSLLLAQNAMREAGSVGAAESMTYGERSEPARAAMRRGVVRVIQALHMLGYLDVPAAK